MKFWDLFFKRQNVPENQCSDIIECENCNFLLKKHTAIEKEEENYRYYNKSQKLFYCKKCAPPWDIRIIYQVLTGEYETYYYLKRVACDENGKIKEKPNEA